MAAAAASLCAPEVLLGATAVVVLVAAVEPASRVSTFPDPVGAVGPATAVAERWPNRLDCAKGFGFRWRGGVLGGVRSEFPTCGAKRLKAEFGGGSACREDGAGLVARAAASVLI